MITGETVVVYRRVVSSVGPDGEPVVSGWVTETVDNVLVSPGPRADIDAADRPQGVVVSVTLHFPKGYSQDLTGAKVSVRGMVPLRVLGSPTWYTAENTPGDWWMPVQLFEALG